MNKFYNKLCLFTYSNDGSLKSIFKQFINNLVNFIFLPVRIKRRRIFNSFASRRLKLASVDKTFDICIYGSDQIWGLAHVGDDMTFFGSDIIKAKNRVAYAASAGETEQEVVDSFFIRKYLKSFSAISVRENTFNEKFKKAGYNCSLVLDPSLLCDEKFFDDIAVKPKKDRYVFIYRVLESNLLTKTATEIGNKLDCKPIEIRFTFKGMIFTPNRYKNFATPEEFLGYIKYAECIVTTSFHGVAFSIVFRKSFYFISTGHKRENRITSLLNQLGLIDRIIKEGEVPSFTPIDYKTIQEDGKSVEQKLLALRDYSQNWLKNAIKSK